MRIHEIPQENRPRERLNAIGVEHLSEQELLAVLLQNGSQGEKVIVQNNNLLKSP